MSQVFIVNLLEKLGEVMDIMMDIIMDIIIIVKCMIMNWYNPDDSE